MTRRLVAAIPLVLFAGLLHAAEPGAMKVILDSDGYADFDDVVGLMAAAASPELEVLGAVATGRDGEGRARAIARALAIMGRGDVPVFIGEPPLSPEPSFSYMGQFPRRWYGLRPELERWADGFPYRAPSMTAVEFMRRAVAAHPGEVTVIVTGPLSTLARAMQVADGDGSGAAFRRSIRQVLFSGGDFKTAEYNVYIDVGAARLVFGSGIPLYQFGGEGEGKAYLARDDRERWWRSATPATWALQDLYRLYRAGWDPTSPFVPILYDVHPVAFLIAGERICRFEPMHVDVDPNGRLVRGAGAPNVRVRVENHGDRLIEWATGRLTAKALPAINHLRLAANAARLPAPEAAAAADALIERMAGGADPSQAGPGLSDLDSRLVRLGKGGAEALEHVVAARGFFLGEPREHAWRDPYTPRTIAVVILASEVYRLLTDRRVAAILAVLAAVIVLYFLRIRRARRRGVAAAPSDRTGSLGERT